MILAPEDCGCPFVIEGASLENSPVCSGTILFMTLLQSFLWGRCNIAEPCKRIVSVDNVDEEYDFIVVGGGSAGSIVLLLEAGGPEPIGAKIPSFYRTFWANQEVDWDYHTVPADYCLDKGSKGCSWPRGKVLDYEDWVQAGAEGWAWEDNLKYFAMTEGNRQIGSVYNHQPQAMYELMHAINETGLPIITDMNDPNTPEGFSIAQAFNADGQRYTTARAFLLPKSQRPNLSVRLYSRVTRVLFEDKRAESLERFDIPVVADLPVGHNLRNHIGATLSFVLSAVDDTFLTGLLYSSLGDRERGQPDMQFFFNGFYAECSRTGQPGEPATDCPENGMNVSANAVNLLPKSVGVITLNSSDPLDAPIFDANYFAHPEDMLVVKEGMRLLKKIFDSQILQDKYQIKLDPEHTARCDEYSEQWSEEWLECIIRVNTDPQNHQLGTAAIGRVVDTSLRVKHLEGNPQGAIMMVAERGAASLREEYGH
ncbi:Glucose oxidase [Operophtera brumata]|uniref:Glucose oxidase n=1 Tax=Operophtera brumata TaxID=104452 RepID=A0A0L7LSJ3_OPEBR|nr:Glucose oxidase [Operophtera brumata]